MLPGNMGCFRYVIVNTLVDVKTNNNNNNNNVRTTNPCNRTELLVRKHLFFVAFSDLLHVSLSAPFM